MVKTKKNPHKKAIANGAKQLAKAVMSKIDPPIKASGAAQKAANAIVRKSTAPANTSFKFRAPVPTYIGVKNGIRIKHTEYVQDLQSSASSKLYSAIKFFLNPANSDTFPWLADQATSYASYRFHSLSFRVGSLVSTATDGMFGICATPDITDEVPTNKTNFMQYENAVRNNVWQAATYHVPADVLKRLPEYLTAVTGVGSTDTTKQMGALFVCSQGLVGTAIDYGELYVTYDVELIHPQAPNNDAVTVQTVPVVGGYFDVMSTATGSTIHVAAKTYQGVGDVGSLQVQAAGDFLVVVYTTTSSGLANPTFAAQDNFGSPVTISSIANITTTTAGINFFRVYNAPKPWYLVSSGGTYGGSNVGRVYITRNYNAETESLSAVDLLEKRLMKIERLINTEDSDDEHIVVESTPNPPSTPAPFPGAARRKFL